MRMSILEKIDELALDIRAMIQLEQQRGAELDSREKGIALRELACTQRELACTRMAKEIDHDRAELRMRNEECTRYCENANAQIRVLKASIARYSSEEEEAAAADRQAAAAKER